MYHVVRIISPWAIYLTLAQNRGGGLIIYSELIYEYTVYKRPIPIQELRAEEGGGLIIHHGLIIRTIWSQQFLKHTLRVFSSGYMQY